MKKQALLLFVLFLLSSYPFHPASAGSIKHENNANTTSILKQQKENSMKKNTILLITILMFLTVGFQAVIAQDDKLDSGAKEILDRMATFQKILENGDSYDANSSPAYPWNKYSTSKEERERFYSKWEPTPYTKKKFDDALNAIAKLLSDKNRVVKEEIPVAMGFAIDEIVRIRKEVDDFSSNDMYLVNAAEGEWLLRAVSAKERERWAKSFFKSGTAGKAKVYQELDALAASAAKQLPAYKPDAENFASHNKAEEEMMKGALKNIATLKIHKIGLFHSEWQIAKNDLDIPISRFKQGYMWVRDSKDDHAYCHLYQVNIIQDYAGGGKYGASYARFLGDTLFGCL